VTVTESRQISAYRHYCAYRRPTVTSAPNKEKDHMASNLDAPRELMSLITFRIPPVLAEALKLAAAKKFSSMSDVARECMANDLRRLGYLD
jgi:hypothetical protein